MTKNKKYVKIGLGLFCAAVVGIVGFQNCGSSIMPLNSNTLSAASSAVVACGGNYTFTAGSSSGTLNLSEDGSGNITGSLNVKNVNGTLSGTCTTANGINTINFTRTIPPSYQIFTGTLIQNTSGLTAWRMTGTYYNCTSSCDAGTDTWSAQ